MKWAHLSECFPPFPIAQGWLDRILMPGVAFDLANGVETPNARTGFISRLTNVRKVSSHQHMQIFPRIIRSSIKYA